MFYLQDVAQCSVELPGVKVSDTTNDKSSNPAWQKIGLSFELHA